MSKPKILFAGCSHTATSGFNEENRILYHWPQLLTTHYNAECNNIAIGGMSNEEIFLRTTEELVDQPADLVVVMWSAISREWAYFADNNIDDFSIINNGIPAGMRSTDTNLQTYAKLHYAQFNNLYIKLKKWLLLTISLENMLKNKNIQYIFIKGFDNLISDFNNIAYVPNSGFINVSTDIKFILDIKNRSDDYICQKLNIIKKLMAVVDRKNWIEFDNYQFSPAKFDFADSGHHPGPKSNNFLVDKLINHINSNKLTIAK